jgi:hypothetical protein
MHLYILVAAQHSSKRSGRGGRGGRDKGGLGDMGGVQMHLRNRQPLEGAAFTKLGNFGNWSDVDVFSAALCAQVCVCVCVFVCVCVCVFWQVQLCVHRWRMRTHRSRVPSA